MSFAPDTCQVLGDASLSPLQPPRPTQGGAPRHAWVRLQGPRAPQAWRPLRRTGTHSRTQRLPSSCSWNSGRHRQRCRVPVSWTQSCWQPPLPMAQELMAGDMERSPDQPRRTAQLQGPEEQGRQVAGSSETPQGPQGAAQGSNARVWCPAWLHFWATHGTRTEVCVRTRRRCTADGPSVEAGGYPAQTQNTGAPWRSRASGTQRPSRLGGPLEEVAASPGTPLSRLSGQGRGQPWACHGQHRGLQARPPAPDGLVQL